MKKKNVIRIIIWSITGLVAIFCLGHLLPSGRKLYTKGELNLKNIYHALSFYAREHNYFSYYHGNPERAFYLLKNMVNISSFDYPYEDRPNPYGIVYWDDNNKEIKNSFYEYVNKPNLKEMDVFYKGRNELDDNIIVVAEKDIGRRKRMFILQSGYLGYTRPHYKGTVVGKRYKEVK